MRAHLPQRIPIILVLWLACFLRWQDPGLVPYTYDDASQIAIAGSIGGNPFSAEGSYPLLSGGTTLGVQRAALHAYLLAVFLKLGSAVEAAVLGIGALGVLATALIYRLGCRIGGRFVGLWSALFLAANPWLVYHDRRLWAHISTLLSILLLYLAWRVIVDKQMRAALWVLPALAIQTLFHTLGMVQSISVVGAILAMPRAWLNRFLVWGGLLACLLFAPYVWTLAQSQPGWLSGTLTGTPTGEAVEFAPRLSNLTRSNHWTLLNHLATGSGFSSAIGREETSHPWWHATLSIGVPLMWLFLGLGIARLCFELLQPLRAPGARMLLLWTVLPMLLLGVQPVRIAFQYWTVLLPLPALLGALGVDWLRKWVGGWFAGAKLSPRSLIVPGIVPNLAALTVIVLWVGSYAVVQDLRAQGEVQTSLRAWRMGIEIATDAAAQAQTEEIRFAVEGLDPAFDGEAAAVATLIGNPPYARFVAPERPSAILFNYTRPSLYYWTIDAPTAEADLNIWGERIWIGQPQYGEPAARLYRLPPYPAAALPVTPLEPAPAFDVGIQLLAYDFPAAPQAQEPAIYTLVWRVLEPPPETRQRDVTAFNHILETIPTETISSPQAQNLQQGEAHTGHIVAQNTVTQNVVAQIDGLALLSRDWWPDDVLVQRYEMTLPPGDLIWRTGLYSRIDGGRAYTAEWADSVDIPFRVLP